MHNKPHSYEVISEAPAGCDYTGTRTLRCKACLSEKTVVVPALGHDFKVKSVIPATASEPQQQHLKCSRCGESEWISVGSPLSPGNQKTGNLENAKVKLNRSVFTYSGKAKTPAVTVVLNGKVVPSRYYSIRYSNNVKAGKASVQVSATGDPYSGSRKTTFIIRPKKTSVSYVKAQKGQMTVQWKKNTTGKGYQVQYSTDKKFKDKKKTKSVKVRKAGTVRTKIRNLEKGATYYVRIRAVSGDAASVWSKAKTVKIKK